MMPDTEEQWTDSDFRNLVMRGYNYRKEYDVEMWGESVTVELRPLTTQVYENLLGEMKRDLSDEEFNTMMTELREMETANKTEEEVKDNMNMGAAIGQVGAVVEAAKHGIDPDSVGLPHQQAVADTIDRMIGGAAVDIGVEVMELTSDLADAEEFPGSRTGE